MLSADGGPVLASNGMSVNSDGALEPLKKGDLLFVVAGFEPLRAVTPALVQWLRKLDRNGVTLGGIDTGSVVLAEAGLLSTGAARPCTGKPSTPSRSPTRN